MASVATLTETTIVGENEEQLVTMVVDNQLFGIPILKVQDIVEASRITPVPLAPSAIAGVLNLRGRIVTVIDLRKLLGNFEEVPWESQMGVTVEHRGDLYTLLVDAIGDVRTLPKRDFDSAPSTLDGKIRQLCSGIFRLRGNLLVVLDVGRILQPESIEATPMLTVEERRSRKRAAQGETDGQKSEKARQLSQLMTDLNAYESEFDSGLDSLATESDDIKNRKKANRSRRPVGERWREVLKEKARRESHTVYRMREPDEETLEQAREEAERQEDEWEAEWQARQAGLYESRIGRNGDEGQGEPPTGFWDAGEPEAPWAGPDGVDAASLAEPGADGVPASDNTEAFDWWNKMRSKVRGAEAPESVESGSEHAGDATGAEEPADAEAATDGEDLAAPRVSAADESDVSGDADDMGFAGDEPDAGPMAEESDDTGDEPDAALAAEESDKSGASSESADGGEAEEATDQDAVTPKNSGKKGKKKKQ